MTTKIRATGTFATADLAPTLRITGGQGNTDRPEVHVAMRYVTPDGETNYQLVGWFDAADLVDAIVEAANVPPRTPNAAAPSSGSKLAA